MQGFMTKDALMYLNIKKYFIYFLLWAPFATITALTIESLFFLYAQFNEIAYFPDRFVLELLFFTLMIPVSHWHKSTWSTLSLIHKRIFFIAVFIGVIDLLIYALVFGYLILEYLKN